KRARARPSVDNHKHCRRSGDWGKVLTKEDMKSRNTKHVEGSDPEFASREPFNLLAWLVFHAVALWSGASFWLRFKRVCAWHEPKPRRMGGNPFARRLTHGLCPDCFARVSAEIISHGETVLHRVTEDRQTPGPSLPTPTARKCAAPARLQRP